jgi:hypothetical protein
MRLTRPAIVLALVAALAVFGGGHLRAQEAQPTTAPAAGPTNPPIPSPKPAPDDPKIHKFAVQQFLAWQQGQIDRTLYSDDVNNELTDEVLDSATKTLANLGALQHVTFRGLSKAHDVTFYVYKMACERGAVDMDFALDPQGKVAIIFFE